MRFALVAAMAVITTPAAANWMFCIAEAGQEAWISDVFRADKGREHQEAVFAAALHKRGAIHAVAQCPAPLVEKMDAFNAQFTAAEFHRKLGQTLHVVEFPRAPP